MMKNKWTRVFVTNYLLGLIASHLVFVESVAFS